MPITPVALGVQPIQLPDPLAQYAKISAIKGAQQENALAQMKMDALRRKEASTNALSRAYSEAYDPATGTVDYNKMNRALSAAGQGAQIPAAEKSRRETETAELQRQKALQDVISGKAKQFRDALAQIDPNDPQAPAKTYRLYVAGYKDAHLGPFFSQFTPFEEVAPNIQSAEQQGNFPTFLARQILGAENVAKMYEPRSVKDVTIMQNGVPTVIDVNTGRVIGQAPPSADTTPASMREFAYFNSLSPEDQRRYVELKRQVPLTPEEKAREAGLVSAATTRGREETEAAVSREQQAASAKRMLQYFEYDPETGTDRVTNLIRGSTSGALQTAAAGVKGAVMGTSTPGMAKIAELKAIMNDLVIGLNNRSLGAGISNADVSYMSDAMGRVGDPMTPVNEREAAWKEVTRRLASYGLTPKDFAEGKAAKTGGTEVPTGRAAPAGDAEFEAAVNAALKKHLPSSEGNK